MKNQPQNKNSPPSRIGQKERTQYLEILKKHSESSSGIETLWNAKNVVAYAEKALNIKLDGWQKNYINCEGNTAVRAGRQSGKSYAESLRVALFALRNPKTTTLVIGAVDRQSIELFEKIKSHIAILAPKQIKGKVLIHRMELRNGSKIIAEPVGRTGYGLRGFTIDKLVVDEAHYIPEEVFIAVLPMLATTNGTIDVLSTPRGNSGFFYDCFHDNNFTCFHTKSCDCPRINKDFLDKQRKSMTKMQFAQEYEAEFLDSLQQFFPKDLVDSCIGENLVKGTGQKYLGIDVARYGGDENSFVVVELINNKIKVLSIETTERISTADTIGRIQALNDQWNFRKIYIDDGGIGGPVLDVLLEKPSTKRKVIGINNASRSITADQSKGKKILKEDLYGNLRRLMEQELIKIPDNGRLILSLECIQFEYTDDKNLKIYGKYSHITEGLIRACYCVLGKGLNIYIA